ncbi:ROK family protein [Actinoplanes sp. NPDC048967]|uniref:ROK family protein n=1 Tax=Actinoplanes sp. NPDC048967 TaxID=3155269 RepID=UPI0033C74FED
MRGSEGFLGIDIGGTKVALRAEIAGHRPLESRFDWAPAATAEQDAAALAAHVLGLVRSSPADIAAVGVALPATVEHGLVTSWPGRPSWLGLELDGLLNSLVPGALVSWADDGDVAALAEADRAGVRNLVYLGVGTGVGGGIISAGRGLPGPGRGSCEIGHLVIERGGRRCDCSRAGCLQAYASGPATLRRASATTGREIDYATLRSAWADGTGWAVAAVEETCAALGTAIIGVTELVRPELVVIGGGFAAGLPGFAETVARQCEQQTRAGHPAAPVRPADHGGGSSLHGAVLLARTLQ